jgi:hypothetical protein
MHAGGDASADDRDEGCGPADDQIALHRLGIEETTLAASATATLIQALTTVGSEADMAAARRHNLATVERAHPGAVARPPGWASVRIELWRGRV